MSIVVILGGAEVKAVDGAREVSGVSLTHSKDPHVTRTFSHHSSVSPRQDA